MKGVAIAVALAVSVPLSALAQSESAVTKAYGDCLMLQAQNGPYTSSDNGKSALQLMAQCETQWKAWVDQCIAATGDG
jgi:hypothetical protein